MSEFGAPEGFCRFICSTAPAPSPSNITLRTRRSGRTSSVAGDSSVAARENKKRDSGAEARSKPRYKKKSKRETSSKLRAGKKAPQPDKTLKPNAGVLQNAIVLAPFHTLKRCFQNKLAEMYSQEKQKKMNRKLKMAEKQKMSFEYDIVELNKVSAKVKKEAKGSRHNQKLRSPSYCQCNRESKSDRKEVPNASKRSKEAKIIFSPKVISLPGHLETKRRKLDSPMIPTPTILKAELSPRLGIYSPNDFLPSETNYSGSRVSSRSKSDSSESFSNSASCRDERLTGSLAISTTSFDSCLERFENPESEFSPITRKTIRRSKPHRSPDTGAHSYSSRPKAKSSRHLIVHVGNKDSDSRIVDFMDREPQTQIISSAESNRYLQPLPRRQSKTRARNADTAPSTGYYLRSFIPSADPRVSDSRDATSSPRECSLSQSQSAHMEAATQVEGASAKKDEGAASVSNSLDPRAEPEGSPSGAVPEGKPGCEEAVELSEQVCEMMSPSGAGAAEASLKEAEGGPGKEVAEGPKESASYELLRGLEGRFEGPGALDESQDKDSDFIFGPRNTASRLGDSCKYSFGLNFVFSDDDD